jgi:iron complex transport system ATP-binding protein
MISIRKLMVKAANGKILVRETSLEIDGARVIGIYGPNGSGKTSFLKAIAWKAEGRNLIGECWVDGKPLFLPTMKASLKARKILYLGSDFQSSFQITVREVLDMGRLANPDSLESLQEVAERFELVDLLNRYFDELSDGEKQRVMIARGVIQSPKWLILDETFSKIDFDRAFRVANALKEAVKKGMGLIMASHDLNLLSELADELWLMKDGRMTADGPVEAVLTSENLSTLYPERTVHVVRSPDSGKKKVIY